MNVSKVLKLPDAVIFVGSGVSLWSKLPSWSRLIGELADYVEQSGQDSSIIRRELKDGDLLQAASYGFAKLTQAQIHEFMRQTCRVGSAKPSHLHRVIVELGPTCFVTTNYDTLIEESLALWRPEIEFRRPVTNRQLVETAEIEQTRATNFVFKPHGDVHDGASIILTREQYRTLLPNGDRHAALDALKTILVTRPVIFIGFGLRDPDFLYVRDVLFNIYKGGMRDHYALMPDVPEEVARYWREQYGVHLISYETRLLADKTVSHDALLDLLLSLKNDSTIPPKTDGARADKILALARYAGAIGRREEKSAELEIRVHRRFGIGGGNTWRYDRFDGIKVSALLDELVSGIIIGAPGAGKTFALRRAASAMASRLQAACLAESVTWRSLIVPVFLDLKLYQGSLEKMISAAMPAGISMEILREECCLCLFVDSYNEVPRRYLEDGELHSDLSKLIGSGTFDRIIIGSRTADGLGNFQLPVYELDEIRSEQVSEELKKAGISVSGRFAPDLMALARRPFFFRYIARGEVEFDGLPHPRTFYRNFLGRLESRMQEKLNRKFDLIKGLSTVAYRTLNAGEEAFSMTLLDDAVLSMELEPQQSPIDSRDVVNYLIGVDFLVPYSGGRVAFVHQSLTEYLAALEFSRQIIKSPGLIDQKLTLRRWDQALFLALSLLPENFSDGLVSKLLESDLSMAMSAGRFVEGDSTLLCSRLLHAALMDNSDPMLSGYELSIAVEKLPLNHQHIDALWKILRKRGALSGGAAKQLLALDEVNAKELLLDMMYSNMQDYNFCVNSIAGNLSPYLGRKDLPKISDWIKRLDDPLNSGYEGQSADAKKIFVSALSVVLENISFEVLVEHFFSNQEPDWKKQQVVVDILLGVAFSKGGAQCWKFIADAVKNENENAVFKLYMALGVNKAERGTVAELLTIKHVDALLACLEKADDPQYALLALRHVMTLRPDLTSYFEQNISSFEPIRQSALRTCLDSKDFGEVVGFLSRIAKKEIEASNWESNLLLACEIKWAGKDELFLEILKTRDERLANLLLGRMVPVNIEGLGPIAEMDCVELLDWMLDITASTHESFWLKAQVGSFIANHAGEAARRRVLLEFNGSTSKYRHDILLWVLSGISGVSTDHLSESALDYCVDRLLNEPRTHFLDDFLSRSASESFVTERLLPLVPNAPEESRIEEVIKRAGMRLGVRFARPAFSRPIPLN